MGLAVLTMDQRCPHKEGREHKGINHNPSVESEMADLVKIVHKQHNETCRFHDKEYFRYVQLWEI